MSMSRRMLPLLLVAGSLIVFSTGCGGSHDGIRVEGSDTMVNVAQAWAEKYSKAHPEVIVQVQGGGSGVGIASLIGDVCDMANASRAMKDSEKEAVKTNRGVDAKEHVVGYDALAVYVHKDNPLDSISMEELAEIYGEDGTITKWSQLGLPAGATPTGKIERISRQNSSGTFFYFREAILGKTREFEQGAVSVNGSKDVVANIAQNPNAIGYSGMGYVTDGVKMLKISRKKGEEGVAPTLETARRTENPYPITRPLRIYTAGDLTGQAKAYLDWILSAEGQGVIKELGYVPVGDHE